MPTPSVSPTEPANGIETATSDVFRAGRVVVAVDEFGLAPKDRAGFPRCLALLPSRIETKPPDNWHDGLCALARAPPHEE